MGELRVPSVFGIDVKVLSIKKLTKSNIVGIDIKIESRGHSNFVNKRAKQIHSQLISIS